MVSVRTSYFQKSNNSTGTIDTEGVSGTPNRSCRPVSLNPAYIAVSTDNGEVYIWDKTGVLQGFHSFGFNLRKICINNLGELLAQRSGTADLYLLDKTGAQLWTVNVPNLVDIGLSESYVVCGINTGVAGTSGVQWRSRADGSLIQNVFGVASAPYTLDEGASPPAGLRVAPNQSGNKVYCAYHTPSPYTDYVEMHDLIAGARLWSRDSGLTGAVYSVMSCYDGAFVIVGNPSFSFIVDINGTVKGSVNVGSTNVFVKLNPNGTVGIAWNTAGSGAGKLYRLIPEPFSSTNFTMDEALRCKDADISEDDYIVYSLGTNVRVRDGATLTLLAVLPVVLTGSPVSVVRNTA